MATLAQVSRINSERGRTLLAILLSVAPYLRWLDRQSAFALAPTDFSYRTYDDADAVKTRQLHGAYPSTNIDPGDPLPGMLAFHGDQIDIDASTIADDQLGFQSVAGWLDSKLASKFRAFAKGYDRKLLSGDPGVNAGEIKGLLTLLDGSAVPGFGAETLVVDATDWIDGAADSFDLSVEANQLIFLEQMEILQGEVDANGIISNPSLAARIGSIAQKHRINGESRDQLGNPISTFGGTELVRVRKSAMPMNEPDNGAGTNTTSLIVANAGEGEFDYATNSGLAFWDRGEAIDEELDDKPSQRVRYEVRAQPRIHSKETIVRVRNLKL